MHTVACLARPWAHRPLAVGLLLGLVPDGHRRSLAAAENVKALRLPAEDRRDDLVPERFQAEPALELPDEILARAGLVPNPTERQGSMDIFDPKAARRFAYIHLEPLGGNLPERPFVQESHRVPLVARQQ